MALILKNDQLALYEIGVNGLGFSTTKGLLAGHKAVQGLVDEILNADSGQTNVAVTMKELVHAGSLLRVAYAAAGNSNAAPLILKLFSKHQSFLGTCVTVTSSFTQGCLNALDHHVDALDLLTENDKDNKEKAIRALKRCGEIAAEQSRQAGAVVEKAKEMENLSEDALIEAETSRVKTADKKEAVERLRDEAETRKKRGEAELKELNAVILELEKMETKYEEKADREAARANKMMVLSVVAGIASTMAGGPASFFDSEGTNNTNMKNGDDDGTKHDTSEQESRLQNKKDQDLSDLSKSELDVKKYKREVDNLKDQGDSPDNTEKIQKAEKDMKEAQADVDRLERGVREVKTQLSNLTSHSVAAAESAEAKASTAAAQRFMKLDQRRETAGDLAAAAQDLANLKTERSELVKAIKALEVCVRLMGQIKTTFLNVRIFWESIEKRCKQLSQYDEQGLQDKSIRKLGIYVEKNMIQWIALGCLNHTANGSIKQALKKVDEGMRNLPTRAEADKILELEADEITKMLQDEHRKIVVSEYATL